MAENENKPGQNGAGTGPASSNDPQNGEGKPAPSGNPESKPDEKEKTLTEKQVNEIVSSRLNRDREKLLEGYGVKSKEELDKLVGSGKGYADLEKKYNESEKQRVELSDKMAFMGNNIKPEKEAEIKALFKGLGKDFNNENLVEMVKTHPEWVNSPAKENAVLKPLGTPTTPPQEETPEQRKARLFGKI